LIKECTIFNINFKFQINIVKRVNHIAIFNFHQLSDVFDNKYHNRGTWTQINFFEQQILWLKKNYKIITLEDAITMANKNLIDDKYACITFDDGDKSILNAMTILDKHNIPATFFINSGYLNNKMAGWFHVYQYIENTPKYNHLLTADIKQNIKYLRATDDIKLYNMYSKKIEDLYKYIKDEFDMFVKIEDLQNINSDLFHIGLHGYEHQRFSMKTKDWQKENILKDINILSKLKVYRPIFAIPFGRPHDWNRKTIEVIFELGLEFVYANGGVNISRNVGYHRIPADGRILKKLRGQ